MDLFTLKRWLSHLSQVIKSHTDYLPDIFFIVGKNWVWTGLYLLASLVTAVQFLPILDHTLVLAVAGHRFPLYQVIQNAYPWAFVTTAIMQYEQVKKDSNDLPRANWQIENGWCAFLYLYTATGLLIITLGFLASKLINW